MIHCLDNYATLDVCTSLRHEALASETYAYDNIFERKRVVKNIQNKSFFTNDEHRLFASSVTDIPTLEHDTHLHGSGLHIMSDGDFLKTHLDYSLHPIMHKERRVNVIVFLSDWDERWGGAFCLYVDGPTREPTRIFPKLNRAVVFETNDTSWHGVEAVRCPDTAARVSAALFYVSDPRPNMIVRHKAQFYADTPETQLLSSIRAQRLLTSDDCKNITPSGTRTQNLPLSAM